VGPCLPHLRWEPSTQALPGGPWVSHLLSPPRQSPQAFSASFSAFAFKGTASCFSAQISVNILMLVIRYLLYLFSLRSVFTGETMSSTEVNVSSTVAVSCRNLLSIMETYIFKAHSYLTVCSALQEMLLAFKDKWFINPFSPPLNHRRVKSQLYRGVL
jgi:hypothetical protein